MAAIDDRYGIATEQGIPWDLPADRENVHRAIKGQPVLMGYRTYQERQGPRKDGQSFVITRPNTELQDGFLPVTDIAKFLQAYKGTDSDIWIMGGAKVYAELLIEIEELYVTRVSGDFNCTKFFPKFEGLFERVSSEPQQIENGVNFHYEFWQQKQATN